MRGSRGCSRRVSQVLNIVHSHFFSFFFPSCSNKGLICQGGELTCKYLSERAEMNAVSLESMSKGLFVPVFVSLAHYFNDNRTLQFETFLLWIDAEMRFIISSSYFYHINYQLTTSNCQTKTTTGLLKTGIITIMQSELGIQLAAVTVPEVPHATICLEHLLPGLLCFFLFLSSFFFLFITVSKDVGNNKTNRPFITYSWRWN